MIKKQGRPAVYHVLTYEELGEYIGAKGIVPVKKSWLDSLGYTFVSESQAESEEEQEVPQIEYKLTEFNNEY